MPTQTIDQLLNQVVSGTICNIVSGFIVDRKAQGLSPKTIRAYSQELRYFMNWCDQQGVNTLPELTADVIRLYLLNLSERRNAGGCHIAYRVLKTLTFWWEQEMDGEYTSPIRKVKPPKITDTPQDPISLDDAKCMLDTCDNTQLGLRDKAVLLCLLDSGLRANEFVSVNLADLNLISGAIVIRHGKGGKTRTVFIGQKSRKAIRAYLRTRDDECPALWITDEGSRLTFYGLRQIIRRRSAKANIKEPGLHSFRRAFAINMLRAGVDIYSLQELMGHADLQVLRRYLKQTNEDIAQAHRMGSPVDNNGL